jgi:hypothetical protein
VKLELLRQADITLSKCGRPQLPEGVSAVPIPRGFTLPMVLDPGSSYTFTKEITGEVPWSLRAISSDQASASLTGVRIQIQLPNGRFLFGGNGIDVGQFCWIGSWKWLQDPELRCEPGSKINVTLSDPTGALASATPVNLLFEGAYLYFLKNGQQVPNGYKLVSSLPRYFGIVNENILTPAWMNGEGVATPPGFSDEYFIYASTNPTNSPGATTWKLAAGAITQTPNPLPFEIEIDSGYEFFVRRVLLDLQLTGTAAAIVLGKLRTGGGYVINDNFIDLARYLNGAEYAGWWRVKGGDSVFLDLQLADFSGTGNVAYQVFLEGFRRRAA